MGTVEFALHEVDPFIQRFDLRSVGVLDRFELGSRAGFVLGAFSGSFGSEAAQFVLVEPLSDIQARLQGIKPVARGLEFAAVPAFRGVEALLKTFSIGARGNEFLTGGRGGGLVARGCPACLCRVVLGGAHLVLSALSSRLRGLCLVLRCGDRCGCFLADAGDLLFCVLLGLADSRLRGGFRSFDPLLSGLFGLGDASGGGVLRVGYPLGRLGGSLQDFGVGLRVRQFGGSLSVGDGLGVALGLFGRGLLGAVGAGVGLFCGLDGFGAGLVRGIRGLAGRARGPLSGQLRAFGLLYLLGFVVTNGLDLGETGFVVAYESDLSTQRIHGAGQLRLDQLGRVFDPGYLVGNRYARQGHRTHAARVVGDGLGLGEAASLQPIA